MSRKDRRRDNLKKVAIGSTLAAAAGYVAGVLTAPKSGKKTRTDIKAATDKGVVEAEKDLKKVHNELNKIITESKVKREKVGVKAQKDLNGLLEKAKVTKQKALEVLVALKKGDAADKDLQKAVKDARDAIDHLKSYLKK